MPSTAGSKFPSVSMILAAVCWWAAFLTKMEAAATPSVKSKPISWEAKEWGCCGVVGAIGASVSYNKDRSQRRTTTKCLIRKG